MGQVKKNQPKPGVCSGGTPSQVRKRGSKTCSETHDLLQEICQISGLSKQQFSHFCADFGIRGEELEEGGEEALHLGVQEDVDLLIVRRRGLDRHGPAGVVGGVLAGAAAEPVQGRVLENGDLGGTGSSGRISILIRLRSTQVGCQSRRTPRTRNRRSGHMPAVIRKSDTHERREVKPQVVA